MPVPCKCCRQYKNEVHGRRRYYAQESKDHIVTYCDTTNVAVPLLTATYINVSNVQKVKRVVTYRAAVRVATGCTAVLTILVDTFGG